MSIDQKVHPLSKGCMVLGGTEHYRHMKAEEESLVYIMFTKFKMKEAREIYNSLLTKNLNDWWTSEGMLPDWYVRSKTNKQYRNMIKEMYEMRL